jgi:Uma2 family endonuclease
MTAEVPVQERAREETIARVASRPITFVEWLDIPDPNGEFELIDGALVERALVQLEHEKLFNWLYRLIGDFVEDHDLGMLFGSRTAVEITEFRGRLPDLIFVRKDRLGIVQQKAIVGPPDLVIEIVSPGDRPSNIVALETDYRAIGVQEIVIIHLPKRRVRTLRKREASYDRADLTAGTLTLETLGGINLELDWLLVEPRPSVRDTLARLDAV